MVNQLSKVQPDGCNFTSLPAFDALSYTWNFDPSDHISSFNVSEVIIVDNCCFHAQGNLYLALEALRHEGQSIPIWIDAICINQHDHQEKGHQVNSMNRIYSSAQTVHVWLGPLNDGLRSGFSFIQSRQQLDIIHHPEAIASLIQLVNRSYWQRAWIRQEVILAKTAQVHCGVFSCDWETFIDVFRDAHIFNFVVRMLGCYGEARSWHESFQERISALLSIDSERREMTQRREKRPDRFTQALMRFGLAEATELRDRVYALLSLYVDTADPAALQADYSISCKQLFFAVLGFSRTISGCGCAELGGQLLKVLDLDEGDMTPIILRTQPIIDEINMIADPMTANQHLTLRFLKDFLEAAESTKLSVNWTLDRGQYPGSDKPDPKRWEFL
ncbi:hypothetical protein PG985_001914 [Apiospora marii]|uniref:uncharacterized protein n=1 Tax=Apiospora marii TaxID=335849 RepID=UPI00312D712E